MEREKGKTNSKGKRRGRQVLMERLKVGNGFLMVYFFVREWDTNSEIRMIRMFVLFLFS